MLWDTEMYFLPTAISINVHVKIILRDQMNCIIVVIDPNSSKIYSPTLWYGGSPTLWYRGSPTLLYRGSPTLWYGGSPPYGTAVVRPYGTAVVRPYGTVVVRPYGTAVVRPYGTAGSMIPSFHMLFKGVGLGYGR